MSKFNLVLSIAVSLIVLIAAGYGLDQHWNDEPAIAQDLKVIDSKADSALFCAYTNKEMYLEMKLREICRRYNRTYPCTTRGMSDADAAEYEQFKKWLEEVKRRISSFFDRGNNERSGQTHSKMEHGITTTIQKRQPSNAISSLS